MLADYMSIFLNVFMLMIYYKTQTMTYIKAERDIADQLLYYYSTSINLSH